MPKLKVYRTPIGFHDAYVAAPSQKAALAAWGSDANLFARGVAEQVTDEALTAEPLARPGEVVKRSRGSIDEQLAALPANRVKAKVKSPSHARAAARPKPPRPDRSPVERAEQALADAERRQRSEEDEIAKAEAALARRRRDMRSRHARETEKLEAKRDGAESAYAKAMRAWRDA